MMFFLDVTNKGLFTGLKSNSINVLPWKCKLFLVGSGEVLSTSKRLATKINVENTNIKNTNVENTNVENTNVENTNIENTNVENPRQKLS